MAELVDALGSGPSGGNTVEVRVLFWAPQPAIRLVLAFLPPYCIGLGALRFLQDSNSSFPPFLVPAKFLTIGVVSKWGKTWTATIDRVGLKSEHKTFMSEALGQSAGARATCGKARIDHTAHRKGSPRAIFQADSPGASRRALAADTNRQAVRRLTSPSASRRT
jgi:hypothetical protein